MFLTDEHTEYFLGLLIKWYGMKIYCSQTCLIITLTPLRLMLIHVVKWRTTQKIWLHTPYRYCRSRFPPELNPYEKPYVLVIIAQVSTQCDSMSLNLPFFSNNSTLNSKASPSIFFFYPGYTFWLAHDYSLKKKKKRTMCVELKSWILYFKSIKHEKKTGVRTVSKW